MTTREEQIRLKYSQEFANHLTKMLDNATSGSVLLSVSERLILIDEINRYFGLLISEINE
jgi:hypothetical protein